MLAAKQGKECREALAEAHVPPIVLMNPVAKPLVRDLMRDQIGGGAIGNRLFAVEDGAGVLHATVHASGLNTSELLVREGPDMIDIEIHCPPRRSFERHNAR